MNVWKEYRPLEVEDLWICKRPTSKDGHYLVHVRYIWNKMANTKQHQYKIQMHDILVHMQHVFVSDKLACKINIGVYTNCPGLLKIHQAYIYRKVVLYAQSRPIRVQILRQILWHILMTYLTVHLKLMYNRITFKPHTKAHE